MNKKRYLVVVGIVVVAVLLSILFYTMFANHRPVITSLEAERDIVILSGSCQIVCNATDPDGDELSYGWSTSGGGIGGQGAVVNWTAPDSAGSYNITAMVSDDHGASVTKQVTITVRANKPPIINSVTADPDWTTPLGKVQVTCNATDPDGDELSYAWLTDAGDISGTGAVVTWTAPEAGGDHSVIVMVTDGYGGSAMSGVGIDVSSAAQAANTELHQVQTAVISCMAECGTGTLTNYGWWSGSNGTIVACNATSGDAAFYIFRPFRAAYSIDSSGRIVNGSLVDQPGAVIGNPWSDISWNTTNNNWQKA
jgi:hypothetical protein